MNGLNAEKSANELREVIARGQAAGSTAVFVTLESLQFWYDTIHNRKEERITDEDFMSDIEAINKLGFIDYAFQYLDFLNGCRLHTTADRLKIALYAVQGADSRLRGLKLCDYISAQYKEDSELSKAVKDVMVKHEAVKTLIVSIGERLTEKIQLIGYDTP